MLISFVVSAVGSALVLRTFRQLLRTFKVSALIEGHFIIFLSLFLLVAFSTLYYQPGVLWICFGIFFISLRVFEKIFPLFLSQHFEKHVPSLIQVLVLSMKSGKTFRQSLMEVRNQHSGWMQAQLAEIHSQLSLPNEDGIDMKVASVKAFTEELKQIDGASSRQVERLHMLRRAYQMRMDFRRRSGKIRQQVNNQSIVMGILFVGVAIFSVFQFEMHLLLPFLISAVTFFVVGVAGAQFLGRSFKWQA